jgi:phage terminase large subunit-like protein
VWDSALSHPDSRRYVRQKYDTLAPAGSRWRARDADNEAELHLPNGGEVVFKAVQQGRAGYQGDRIRLGRFDEEPRDYSVVQECRMRTADEGGRLLFTLTPLYGWSELLRAEIEQPDPRTVVRWLHGTDNPHVPEEVLRQILAKYGSHERAARERGHIVALEGRVWSEWEDRAPWVVPATTVPEHWPRYVGIDWGTSVPTAMLLGAYDEGTDTLHVLDEDGGTGWTIPDRVARIRSLEAGHPPVQMRFVDPEDASTNRTIVGEYDVQLDPATKAIRWGVNVVATRIRPDALGRPHLVIHERCVKLRRELQSYVWGVGEKPRKIDDHYVDAMRYLTCGVARQYGLVPPPAPVAGAAESG